MWLKNNKAAATIILFLIIFIILIIILMFIMVRQNSNALMELPSITFTVLDDESVPHTINAKAAFVSHNMEVDDEKKEEINKKIEEAIRKTDYNTLTGKDGFEYMKTVVRNELENEYGEAVGEIYFGQFSCDLVEVGEQNGESNYKDDVIHGLFPKTKEAK